MNEATIAKKHEEVQVIREKISKAGSTLFVDYLGLTVAEVTELRVKLQGQAPTRVRNPSPSAARRPRWTKDTAAVFSCALRYTPK